MKITRNRYILISSLLLWICGQTFSALSQNHISKHSFYIEPQLSQNDAYVGEVVLLSYMLYSDTPDVVEVEMEPVDDNGLTLTRLHGNEKWEKVKYKGKEMWRHAVRRYKILATESGKYTFGNCESVLTLAVNKYFDDPFWGRMTRKEYVKINCRVDKEVLKVKKLPVSARNLPIGNFEISATLPSGYIKTNDDALILVTISGEGELNQMVPTNEKRLFEDAGLELIEIKRHPNQYLSNGKLTNEVEIEYWFRVPDVDAVNLSSFEIKYFNPDTGKIEKSESAPIKIIPGSTVNPSKQNTPPVLIEI